MKASHPIRVLFDLFELSPNAGKSIGIYVYAIGLLRAMANESSTNVKLVVACHADNLCDVRAAVGSSDVEVVSMAEAHPGRLLRQWWLRFGAVGAAKRLRCDVYFSPKGFLPGVWGRLRSMKTCVVVHDLIPMWYAQNFPSQFGRLEKKLVIGGLIRSCRYADLIVAISHATANEILALTGRRDGTAVIYNGLDDQPASNHNETDSPYILAMTSSLPHKNAEGVLEAYRLYRDRASNPMRMIVCGLEGAAPEGVTYRKGISRVDLTRLYQSASVFLFLSRAEGFGYPPLEAMQQGTVCVCSDLPVLRETTRGRAVYVDPLSPVAVADVLLDLTSGANERTVNELKAVGPSIAGEYSWGKTARAYLARLEGI